MMNRQNYKLEPEFNPHEPEPVSEYDLDELLFQSSAKAFSLELEDKQWLSGPIIEESEVI